MGLNQDEDLTSGLAIAMGMPGNPAPDPERHRPVPPGEQ
jgi:hypothetical protein